MNVKATNKAQEIAIEYLQIVPAEILAMVARGEVDLNNCARLELSYRGLDENGKWVGFDEAEKRLCR